VELGAVLDGPFCAVELGAVLDEPFCALDTGSASVANSKQPAVAPIAITLVRSSTRTVRSRFFIPSTPSLGGSPKASQQALAIRNY
jgi:hypothetical protein